MKIFFGVFVLAIILKLVDSFQASYTHLHGVSASIDSSKNDHNEYSAWDDALQHEAAEALLPVFFPDHNNGSGGSAAAITAETTLKRLFRRKYQRQPSNKFTCTDQSDTTMDESRRRLAELILGTSVMRLRHFVVASAQGKATFPLPYPLTSIDLPINLQDDQRANCNLSYGTDEKMIICEMMVKEHARHLLSSEDSQLEFIKTLVGSDDDPALPLAIQYSIPLFLASSLLSQYGNNTTKQICSLMNEPGPITIRKNTILFNNTDDDLCRWLWENDGVEASPMTGLLSNQNWNVCNYDLDETKRYKVNARVMGRSLMPPRGCLCINPKRMRPNSIWSMSGYRKGFFEVQDAGSQSIIHALDMTPSATSQGLSVLDYCAGNGGKTFQIASYLVDLMKQASKDGVTMAQIISHDVVDDRLRQIKGSMHRVGFDHGGSDIAECKRDNLRCTLQTVTPTDLKEISDSDTLFDVVLVDAPCSSSGVLRRRPSQRWLISEEEIKSSLPSLQLEIIQNAASFVREGGTLVYATCSLLQEENENVVKCFEKSEVFKGRGFFPWPFSDGDEPSEAPKLGLSRRHEITLLPSEWNDGFYFARYKRIVA